MVLLECQPRYKTGEQLEISATFEKELLLFEILSMGGQHFSSRSGTIVNFSRESINEPTFPRLT